MIFVSETQFHVYLFSTNFMYACLAQCHSVLIINRFLNSSKFAKVRFQLLCSDEERDQSLGRVNEFEECSLSPCSWTWHRGCGWLDPALTSACSRNVE